MFLLLVKAANDHVHIEVYKIYRNKKVVHELTGSVGFITDLSSHLVFYNPNKIKLADTKINFKTPLPMQDKLKAILQHEKLIKYEFNYIINKIKDGGENHENVILLHAKTLSDIVKSNNSAEQKQQTEIADYLHQYYKKAKHYLCFDSGFYSTINLELQKCLEIPTNKELGLKISSISNKLLQYQIKKDARQSWLIVYIEPEYTVFTVIKKFECVTSHQINLNLFEKTAANNEQKILDKKHCLKIAQTISEILTIMHGVFGIVISGELGYTNNKIRKSILKSLSWSGILINSKANKNVISKKISTVPILLINSDENEAILGQLDSRL